MVVNKKHRNKAIITAMMVVVMLVMQVCVAALPDASSAVPSTPYILVLGDSLSAGYGIDQGSAWVNLMAERLKVQGYPHQVVNASISGETSRGGLVRLNALLARYEPAIVIIALGANDGLRGLPLNRLRDNLADMIKRSQGQGAVVLLAGIQLPSNYGARFNKRLMTIYRDLKSQKGVALVPFLLEGVVGDRSHFLSDGLHPTAAMQPRIMDNVWQPLKALLR